MSPVLARTVDDIPVTPAVGHLLSSTLPSSLCALVPDAPDITADGSVLGVLEDHATTVTPGPALNQRVLPDDLITYTRASRRQDNSNPAVMDFIGKVTKPVQALAPTPTVHKRRRKTAGPVSLPRRSRRLANLPPELDRVSATKVCRKLGLADEDGRISDEALARYSKFYNHLLSSDHLAAVSALFGWEVPPEGHARAAAISITVN
ncbi:hypothetical protein PVAP13_8KG201200 [Panicum virgatum]|uniref:Uncharacterized protein n=1 Tax=Panicum virgatum TaxID=38727 RepID=A0A8T0PV14_PANVG|nr:hypothetical protein PVAP13_8KG201200 [Panicum virgatum]